MRDASGAATDEPDEGDSVRTRTEPAPSDAATFVAEALADGALVTVFGTCRIVDGESDEERDPVDRHLLLKPDDIAVIHSLGEGTEADGRYPGNDLRCRVEDGELVVEAQGVGRDGPVCVRFSTVAHVAAFGSSGPGGAPETASEGEADPHAGRGSDTGSPAFAATEADLKARILDEPDLVEGGFTPLATERETPAGAVDVYGRDDEGRTVVLELKRRRAGPDAVGQLRRYVDALERDLHAEAEIRGVLVAPSVTERARALLNEEGLEFVPLTPTGGG